MKRTTYLLLIGTLLVAGCSTVIDYLDPKAQAWRATLKHHAKVHPECGRATWCKRLQREIGPGTDLSESSK